MDEAHQEGLRGRNKRKEIFRQIEPIAQRFRRLLRRLLRYLGKHMVQVCVWLIEEFTYVASIFCGVGDGKKEMLRKKTHVVRKKTHVVRKFFYVASIFGGAAGRKNRSPWELSSTAGDFSSTASRRRQRLQCVYRAPVFSMGAHTSLPDTNNSKARFSRQPMKHAGKRGWGPTLSEVTPLSLLMDTTGASD